VRVPHPPGGAGPERTGAGQTKTNRNIFSVLFLLVSLAASAAHAVAPYAQGEVIRYGIKKMGIKLGEATLEFKGETPATASPTP
jgi:hypothetical protein